jgi:hypothetical protein
MKKLVITLLIFINFKGYAQTFADFIDQHAIELKSPLILEKINGYKCLMVGEMHGTQEPAEFITDIVKIASKKGKKIILGLEIPPNDMKEFIKKRTIKNLKKTKFFSVGYGDGRNNEAWFKIIETCKKLKNVEFCFFDVDSDSRIDEQSRDSLMFSNLINVYKKDTTQVIYTIGGNFHNKIKPFRQNKTFGCYMAEYFSIDKVMSIFHAFGNGTTYNRENGVLKIRKIEGQSKLFTVSIKFAQYFLPKLPRNFTDDYTAFFYTGTITASMPIYVK